MEKKIKVKICVGTQCYVMGNHELKDLKNQLPADLKEKVYVEGSVCLGCDNLTERKQPPYIGKADFESIVSRLRELANQF